MGQFDVLGGRRGQLPSPTGNAGIYELRTYVRRCTYFGELLGEGDNKGESGSFLTPTEEIWKILFKFQYMVSLFFLSG